MIKPLFSLPFIANAIRRLLAGASGNSGEDQIPRRKNRRQAAVGGVHRSSEESGGGAPARNRKKGKPKTKRSKSEGAVVSGEADVIDTSTVLRKLAGGQPLVDDFDEADFEERKVGRNGDACMPSI